MNVTELFDLHGKTALVTGSTKGIGKELARGLAAAGARVWLHGRDEQEGVLLANELHGHFVQADLAQTTAVEQIADAITRAEPRLDILVNNAGFELPMSLEHMDMTIFDLIWQVNVRAAVQLTHLLLPLLKTAAPHASIINVTSIHDTMPYAYNGAYAMSKAALAMFTKTSAIELAPLGIRVNNLAPGAVETNMNREVLDTIGRELFQEWIPLGRPGRTEEMIGPVLFLASHASSYVTGATLYADGGYIHHLVRYRLAQEEDEKRKL